MGGGHNGLTAAAYLAKAGKRVLVAERRAVVGGAAVTEEVAPGARVSSCSYIASMLTPGVIRDLALARYGLEMVACDPALNLPTSDGRLLRLWGSAEKTAGEIARYSARDAAAYIDVDRMLRRLARVLQPFFLEPPPNLEAKGLSGFAEVLRAGRRAYGLGGEDVAAMIRFLTGSLAEFVDRHFESDEARRLMLANNVYGKHGGPYESGSTLGLLFHLLSGGESGDQGYSGHVIGGTGAISEALAKAAADFGATILTDAEVAEIRVTSGRVEGIALTDGRTFSAPRVLSNADPKRTFLKLVDRTNLDDDFREDINAIRMAGPAAKVNMWLAKEPLIAGMAADATPAEKAVLSILPSFEDVQRLYDGSRFGELGEELWIDCVVPSQVDPTLCPEGTYMMTCFVQYVPYKLKDGTSWNDKREELGDRVCRQIEQFVPGLRESILARKVITPLDLEETYGLTEGNIFHGDLNLGQLFMMRPVPEYSQYNSPIKGLSLCGAGAHPGGGVTGAPGRNAALAALKRWR
ncbi:MAG: NAD(P)/FAD-dependent oxidoreductase [Pacificimonas sp.]|nr:NAD(P)/FAD-dependent oxidoreductase [Pacificimonas sp.]